MKVVDKCFQRAQWKLPSCHSELGCRKLGRTVPLLPVSSVRCSLGFTLIEILVVLLIISIVTTVAMLSISYSPHQRAKLLANTLADSLILAEEQAILQQTTLGLVITTEAFQFVNESLQSQGGVPDWQPVKAAVFNKHLIPSNIALRLEIAGKTISLPKKSAHITPQIVISSGGEVTPFTLWIGATGHAASYKVVGEANGHIEQSAVTP
ncbi:MAG: type II secretion system protein GspH [Gammaproteobacteria bacterium RIFCSPHIGHO2_12_FULL_41_20]|nr:MAG: type II secretion system protein GspH [Gammaproteobacteria bacterium RIFCSPHIGHO2_12_FULL_41_20]